MKGTMKDKYSEGNKKFILQSTTELTKKVIRKLHLLHR